MRSSVTQEFEYGCGIACYAFVHDVSYRYAESLLGGTQSKSERFWVNDLTAALCEGGKKYVSSHVNVKTSHLIYSEADIVLIRRSKRYPVGHYLVRHNGLWMDPWINMVASGYDIRKAISGFRERLPGRAMYIIKNVGCVAESS